MYTILLYCPDSLIHDFPKINFSIWRTEGIIEEVSEWANKGFRGYVIKCAEDGKFISYRKLT